MKKKLLFISSRIPFPLVGGDKIRVFNSLQILSKRYDIELLYIDTEIIRLDYKKELKKYCSKITPFVVSKYEFLWNTLKGFLKNKKPLQVNYYYFKEIQKYIDDRIGDFDVVFCNHIRTTEYLDKHEIIKYVDLVDSIAMNYTKAYSNSKGLWKLIYAIERRRVKKYERFVVESFTKTIVISDVDKRFIDSDDKYNISVIGNFVREMEYDKDIKPTECKICFLGKMDYEPNVSAVKYFVKNIFSSLKEKNKDIEFIIIGAKPTMEVQKLSYTDGVVVTGFVDNPYNEIQKCNLFVAPMVSGAGVQNKILEAMKMGKCVVTTQIGAEGLVNLKGRELIVCEDDQQMIESIIDLLENNLTSEKIGKRAKAYVENNYSEELVSNQLDSLIQIV